MVSIMSLKSIIRLPNLIRMSLPGACEKEGSGTLMLHIVVHGMGGVMRKTDCAHLVHGALECE